MAAYAWTAVRLRRGRLADPPPARRRKAEADLIAADRIQDVQRPAVPRRIALGAEELQRLPRASAHPEHVFGLQQEPALLQRAVGPGPAPRRARRFAHL